MNEMATLLAADSPLDHVVEHPIAQFGPVVFTNHMLMVLEAAAVLLIVLPLAVRRQALVPRGLYSFVEAICQFLREELARPLLGKHVDRYIQYLWTTFFFILACNLLGMLPTESLVTLLSLGRLKHLGGTATANIYVTGTLAALALVMIHVSGARQQGVLSYLKNFIPHVPWPLIPFMYVLEFAGALIKPFALAIRLFANMLAGHTVLAALLLLALASRSYAVAGVTVLGCAALSLLELFVAFLQAYIFTFLTALFLSTAVHPEH